MNHYRKPYGRPQTYAQFLEGDHPLAYEQPPAPPDAKAYSNSADIQYVAQFSIISGDFFGIIRLQVWQGMPLMNKDPDPRHDH